MKPPSMALEIVVLALALRKTETAKEQSVHWSLWRHEEEGLDLTLFALWK